ncbi:MAG: AraC family transcriptional regulator [Pseudomonadota bacterium]
MAGVLGVASGVFGRVALFQATEPVAEHAHPQVHVLIKVSGPDNVYRVDGEVVALTGDRMVLINPWVAHSNLRAVGHDPTVLLALYVDTLWLEMSGSPGVPVPESLPFSQRSAAIDSRLRLLIDEFAADIATASGDFAQLEDKLAELIGQIFDQAEVQNFKKSEYSSWSSDYRVRKAIRRIRENPVKSLSLADLAEDVGLSRSQFYTRFKACTGMSPGFYLDIMCWERAAESLCRAEQSIAEISDELGFASQGHFTRFFKAKTGVTPRSFRMGTLPDD